jgi:hypothetical protein
MILRKPESAPGDSPEAQAGQSILATTASRLMPWLR